MKPTLVNPGKAFVLALAPAIGAMGIHVAEADDAPGAAVIGMLLMFTAVVLGVKAARNQLPAWAARTALAVGALIAAFAAFLTHATVVAAPLFAQPQDVPSVVGRAPSPQWAAGADRARQLVRAAISEQNLPGLSIAVGAGGDIIWAEGFGWRDVETRTPVTPNTRFNIGTAASDLALRIGDAFEELAHPSALKDGSRWCRSGTDCAFQIAYNSDRAISDPMIGTG